MPNQTSGDEPSGAAARDRQIADLEERLRALRAEESRLTVRTAGDAGTRGGGDPAAIDRITDEVFRTKRQLDELRHLRGDPDA